MPVHVYTLMNVQMYTDRYKYMFSSIPGKKQQEGTTISMWYGVYEYHKVMCFQFFMPEVIIVETS